MKFPKLLTSVVFDLDGTLLNTLDELHLAANRMLAHFAMPHRTKEEVRLRVGNGADNLIRRLFPINTTIPLDHARNVFMQAMAEYRGTHTTPYPGVIPLLQSLAERQIAMGVYSNKPDRETQYLVDSLLPDIPFKFVLGHRPPNPLKPNPEALLKSLSQAGLSPDHSAMIGDSAVDMDTGRAAGMSLIGVSWGFRPVEELLEHRADAIIDQPDELLNLL